MGKVGVECVVAVDVGVVVVVALEVDVGRMGKVVVAVVVVVELRREK